MFRLIKETPAVPAPRTQGLHLLFPALPWHITELLTPPSVCIWATALGLLLNEGMAPSSHELFHIPVTLEHCSRSAESGSEKHRPQFTLGCLVPSPTSNDLVKGLAAVLFDLRTIQLLIPFPQWKWHTFLPEKKMKERLARCYCLCSCMRFLFSLINGLDSLCVLKHINPTLFSPEKKYAFILLFADLLWAGSFQCFRIKTISSYTLELFIRCLTCSIRLYTS